MRTFHKNFLPPISEWLPSPRVIVQIIRKTTSDQAETGRKQILVFGA